MSTFFKFVLGLFTGLFVLALAGGLIAFLFFRGAIFGLERAVTSSRTDVPEVAASIAAITLPAGFTPDYALQAGGYAVAAYRGADDRSHLILARGPKDLDIQSDDLKTYAEQQTGSHSTRLTPVGSFEVTINGQPVTVQISEGRSGDDTLYRQASAAFQGQNGPTLVNLTRPLTAWDEAEVKALFSSIH